MWDDLSEPWQAAAELAWEAYCEGTVPIGAVVAGPDGCIVARGRNRILNGRAHGKQIYDSRLAHAEVNALLELKLDRPSLNKSTLYTTMEPCPLCMGAFYMSGVYTLHFAARDPYAGSVNLLGTTPYLCRKPISVVGPLAPVFEDIMIGLHTEFDLTHRGEARLDDSFYDAWREVVPRGVSFGAWLYRSGFGRQLKASTTPAASAYDKLAVHIQESIT